MYTITVVSEKGGSGKSTLVCNLAAQAHLAGARTVVLDMDPQKSALSWHAKRLERGGGSRLASLVVRDATRLRRADELRALAKGYDVVFCDGPPRLGDVLVASAVIADVVLMPFQPGPLDWWAAPGTLEAVDTADVARAKKGIRPVRRVYVINRPSRGSKLERYAVDALSSVDGTELAPIMMGNRVAFTVPLATGEAAVTAEPEGKAAQEIVALYSLLREQRGEVACA